MNERADGDPFADLTETDLGERFAKTGYVADAELLTTVFLALKLGNPLLVEGDPGSGKTELGKALADGFDTELIRLQCYEGLTAESTLYEWNYTKQLLAIRSGERAIDETNSVFDSGFLLERPLLQALTHEGVTPPVLLIDEIDRSDEQFEAFLLELLSDYQVSIPEYGTVTAERPPIVVITTNRTRKVSDALKRRCLSLHVEPPSFEAECQIVQRNVPHLDATVASEVCVIVRRLREESFLTGPGVAETLDWARAVATLRSDAEMENLSATTVERTLTELRAEAAERALVDTDHLDRLVTAASEASRRNGTETDRIPTTVGEHRPDFVGARDHVITQVVRFARTLRFHGVDVPVDGSLSAVEALAATGVTDRGRVRAATHATLVSDPHDSEVFDERFPVFWYRLKTGLEAIATADDVSRPIESGRPSERPLADASTDSKSKELLEDALGDVGKENPSESAIRTRRIADETESPLERFLDDHRSGTFSASGKGRAVEDEGNGDPTSTTVTRFERALATLSGRRWHPDRTGYAIDARRLLRESLSTGGVPPSLPTRDRRVSEVRACVLVDVSRSVLDAIDRGFLLTFLEALVRDCRSVRIFFFDTDIKEVTDVFVRADDDPATALERAEVVWGGGTKIGASLSTLLTRWPNVTDYRTATLVVSDGLDVGDIDDLEAAMARLSLRSGSILWLNPLAASPAYEPTCQGMAAALPYIDGLFAFAGPQDVAEVARQLDRYGPRGPMGFEYDFRERAAGGGVTAG